MIIYGARNKELAKAHLTEKCPHCGTQNSIDMHVFQKYAHVFWIPFFPMKKLGISQCSHCKQALFPEQMPMSLKTIYGDLKAQSKTPIWTFTGLALVAVLIIAIFINDRRNDQKNAQLILTPQAGDIFEIEGKNYRYTLFKVDHVQGDTVYIRASNYEVNKVSGLDDLKRREFSTDVYGFAKARLKEMLSSGEIIDIERK